MTAALAMLAPGALLDATERQILETSATISYLGAEINRRMVEGTADAGRLYDMASARMSADMSAAIDVVSDTSGSIVARVDRGLAHIDGWMTAVSLKVITALPGAPDHIPVPVSKRQQPEQAPVVTASISHTPSAPAFNAALDAGKTPAPRQHKPAPEKFDVPAAVVVPAVTQPTEAKAATPEIKLPPARQVAKLPDIEVIPAQSNAPSNAPTVVMPAPALKEEPVAAPVVAAGATPQPAQLEIKLPASALAEAKAGALVPADVKIPVAVVFDKKSVLASLGPTHTAALAKPLEQPAPALVAPSAGPAPAAETEPAREEKPDDKLVVASLSQPAAMDVRPLAIDKPAEAKAVPVIAPFDADEQNLSSAMDMFPASATRLPSSTPLKMRPLTRADIPSSEKFASLTSAKTDARILPTEQQRVAYDAPVPIDEPTSIGRRKWVEEANKYQGLGKPEALLEALRHMGSNAKTLGLPASLWCADFVNLVLRKSGIKATGSRAAKSYLEYGQKIDEPRVGAIAIFSRGRNGGHIGIVRGTDGNGNPIIVSGNHGNKVAESVYPKARVLAYVVPR